MKLRRRLMCWVKGGHDRVPVPRHEQCGYCRRCKIDLCGRKYAPQREVSHA